MSCFQDVFGESAASRHPRSDTMEVRDGFLSTCGVAIGIV